MSSVSDILNGQPASILRDTVSIDWRKQEGAFFTSRALSNRLLYLLPPSTSMEVYCDPACGAGDLLLAAASRLPLGKTLRETISTWGDQLIGFDTAEAFVTASKARLILFAALRCGSLRVGKQMEWSSAFPRIRKANGLTMMPAIGKEKHLIVVLNPPYSKSLAQEGCDWATGQINSAAIFMDNCVSQCISGTTIAAILPDVLRSGARYRRWREKIMARCEYFAVENGGQFDAWTDVNFYFSVCLIRQQPNDQKLVHSKPSEHCGELVSDRFHLSVGPVVPHRHRKVGPLRAYIHPRSIKQWSRIKRITESRRFSGKVINPPFVAVRRTSRPGDDYRAVATIITGKRPVAIENHLIVLSPKNGTISDCELLMDSLKHPGTSDWLDQRIRCRHLTVDALKDLPIFSNGS